MALTHFVRRLIGHTLRMAVPKSLSVPDLRAFIKVNNQMKGYFSDYAEFSSHIQSKYRDLAEKYPLVFFVFYKEIAKSESGMSGYHARAMANMSSFSPGRLIYRYLVLFICKKYFYSRQKSAYVSLDRFPEVRVEAIKHLRTLGIVTISPLRKGVVFKSLRKEGGFGVNLNKLPLSGFVSICVLRRIKCIGLLKAVDNDPIIRKLEYLIKKEIEITRRILKLRSVRLIISQSDSSPTERIIVEAAQREGIPYIVVAHGYIGDRKLRSIAPIAADRLVVWTKAQLDDLAKVMSKREAGKLRYYGWPKARVTKMDVNSSPLIVLSTIYHEENCATDRTLVERAIAQLAKSHKGLRVRLHPKEWKIGLQGVLSRLYYDKLIKLAHGDIQSELGRSNVVIGMHSSVLVEAAKLGIPVFQFRELKKMDIEGVETISIEDFQHLGTKLNELETKELPDDHARFSFCTAAMIDDALSI